MCLNVSMSEMQARYEALDWTLGDRLEKALRFAGKSHQDMADDLGVHRNTISNYTSGRRPVDRRTKLAWAVATGVPFQWLDTGRLPADADDDGPNGGLANRTYPILLRLAS